LISVVVVFGLKIFQISGSFIQSDHNYPVGIHESRRD